MLNFTKKTHSLVIIIIGGLAIIISLLDIYSISLYRSANTEQQRLTDGYASMLSDAHSLRSKFLQHVQEWKSILLRGQNHDQYYVHLKRFYRLEREIRKSTKELQAKIQKHETLLVLLLNFEKEFRRLGKEYRQAIKVYNASAENPHILADQMTSNSEATELQINSFVDAMEDWRATEVALVIDETNEKITNSFITFLLFLIGMLFVSLWIIQRRIVNPIKQATTLANSIASGNLNNSVDSSNTAEEIGILLDSLDEMQKRIYEAQKSLIQARIKAEDASRTKSEFLSNMSHELRTPLNSIIGFSTILYDGGAGAINSEQKLQLRMIKGSASHLLNLVNDILDISKIEAGEVHFKAEGFELAPLLEELNVTMRPLVEEKNIQLKMEIENCPSYLFTDKAKLKQIILNLLSNAIKFTDDGSVILKCSRSDNNICFTIVDTGIGIDEDKREVIFDAFQQADLSDSRAYEGTGLGLAICKKYSELLGGHITVESTPGKGSAFNLILPLSA